MTYCHRYSICDTYSNAHPSFCGQIVRVYFNHMKIGYLNAPAGSGKTHCAILGRAVEASLGGGRILVAVPTKDLINQTMADIAKLHRKPEKVVSIVSGDDCHSQNVVSRTIDRLRARKILQPGGPDSGSTSNETRIPPSNRSRLGLKSTAVQNCCTLTSKTRQTGLETVQHGTRLSSYDKRKMSNYKDFRLSVAPMMDWTD